MPTLAAFRRLLELRRKREGLRACRTAWLFSVTVREYRELEAGDRLSTLDTHDRVSRSFGWPGSRSGTGDG